MQTGRQADAETRRTNEERQLEEHRKKLARYEKLLRTYVEKIEIEKRYIFAYGEAVKQQKERGAA